MVGRKGIRMFPANPFVVVVDGDGEGALGAFLRSPVARTIAVTVAGTITRSLLGTLMGKRR